VYQAFGRHDWENAREHADTIEQLSGEQLVYDQRLSRPPFLLEFSRDDLEVYLMESITKAFGNIVHDLEGPLATYITALREGKLIGVYPALFQQTFQKKRQENI
jgi:hypothetical protein